MIIAISGKSGCGNTTVSQLVAERLEFELVNFTFRNLAAERGVSLKDIIKLAGEDDNIDREVDRRQRELALNAAKNGKGCVLGSRLAIWVLPEAHLKVYLEATPEVRAARIVHREGGNPQEVAEFTKLRDSLDSARYKRIYGIDNSEYRFADLIIDTNDLEPDVIAGQIIEHVQKTRN